MQSLSSAGLSVRIFLPMVALGGLILAFFMGRWVAHEQYFFIAYIFIFFFALTFLLWTGDKYWYGIPFALGSGLPAVPMGFRNLELGELMILAATAIFLARVALKKEKPIIFRATHIPVLLFILWVGLIYTMNPSGFAMFGSGTAGARNYFKIALAFCAFIVMASQDLSEERMKWPIRLLLLGTIVSAIYGFASFQFLGSGPSQFAGEDLGDQNYTWHQSLSAPAITFTFLLFARYKPSQVFSMTRPYLVLVYALTFLIALYSGKRMAIVSIVMAPLMASVIHREFRYVFLSLLVLLAGSAIIVTGQGSMFNLPNNLQRAISFLPADWAPEYKNMTLEGDGFRGELRRLAMEKIKDSPIIGRGYSLDVSETAATLNAGGGGDIMMGILAGAQGGAWHNTWLGYTAAFGIPLTMFHASLWLTVLGVSFWLSRRLPAGSYLSVFAIYVFLFTVRDVIASHTSGNTATDAYMRWWMYGGLFSIYAAYWLKQRSRPVEEILPPSPVFSRGVEVPVRGS